MILTYGESQRNLYLAVRLYEDRFPDNPRSRASFYRVVNQFRTTGSVEPRKRTRRVTVTGEENQIAVLAAVALDPHAGTRGISRDLGMSQSSVRRILKKQKFHPYHVSLHQDLQGNDHQNRVAFCQWASERIDESPDFFHRVLFSDESSFTNHGTVNRHNMHYWSAENPHWVRQVDRQRPWAVNVWCGLIGSNLIGPIIIEGNLNGQKYCQLLEQDLPVLLEELNLQLRQTMWFQQDGCPAHFSRAARTVLDGQFPGRWIGRGGPVNWPARSPDLTSPDFFLWGHLKEQVYRDVPTTRDNMVQRIRDACRAITPEMLERCVASFEKRIVKCIEVTGDHFEHLM